MNYDKAKELIKKFEGLRLKAYKCPAGIWTIGYGHTKGVTKGMEITQEQAEKILENDIAEIAEQIKKLGLQLNENQFNAILSFVFNIGIGKFAGSTMCRLLRQKNYKDAGNEFYRWCYAGGKVLEGLKKRREAERELFFRGENEV
ncbi:MAG: lysozyme [Fervidobacterium sp.]